MRHIPIPRDVSSDTQRAIQLIDLALRDLDIPLLHKRSSLSGISEGTSAYFLESDGLYRYTKIGGKLYKEKVAVEAQQAPAAPAPVVEDSSNVEVLREVSYTPDEPRTIVLDYTREAGSPQAVSFSMEWYRLLDTGELESLSESEQPTDIRFSPETPSSEAGKHYVSVTFTPREYAEDDRIIGRVLVREEGDGE